MDNERINVIIERKDDHNNRLTYNEDTGEVLLQQQGEVGWKNIGKIYEHKGSMVYDKREKERDVYRKFYAWSVYYLVLEIVDVIRYQTESFVYWISKDELMYHGFVMQDYGHHFTPKVVCSIRHWKMLSLNKALKPMISLFGNEWTRELSKYLQSTEFRSLGAKVAQQRKTVPVYPEKEDLFKAFRFCPFSLTKLVLIGDEPYIGKQSGGMLYHYEDSLDDQPETVEFLDWIENTIKGGFWLSRSSDLTEIASNGVLLLHSIYTCTSWGREVHKELGWDTLNKAVLSALMNFPFIKFAIVLVGKEKPELSQWIETQESKSSFLFIDATGGKNQNALVAVNDYLEDQGAMPIKW